MGAFHLNLWLRTRYLTTRVLDPTLPNPAVCVITLFGLYLLSCANHWLGNMLFNTSCVSPFLAQSHRFCNASIWPFTDAMFQAVLSYPSLSKNKVLFNSSPVSTSLAHSNRLCYNTVFPFSISMCQAVYSSRSLAKNNVLFNSSPVSTSLAHSHNLCNIASWPFSAATRQSLCLT